MSTHITGKLIIAGNYIDEEQTDPQEPLARVVIVMPKDVMRDVERLPMYEEVTVIKSNELAQLRADLATAREALEAHAWTISPGMAQAKIDELNRQLTAAYSSLKIMTQLRDNTLADLRLQEDAHLNQQRATISAQAELADARKELATILAACQKAERERDRFSAELAKIYAQREEAQGEMSEMEDQLTTAREALKKIALHKHHSGDTVQADQARAALDAAKDTRTHVIDGAHIHGEGGLP